MEKKKLTAVSLFTGAGGMDVGFERAGFEVLWANDINEKACETYQLNHKGQIECGPLEDHLASLKRFRGVDLLFGGPPCQGFSVAGKMDPEDARSQLIWRFFDAVAVLRPAAFVCENVKALAVLSRWRRARTQMYERATQLGYKFTLVILNSSRFGVPQSRERMFLVGARNHPTVQNCVTLFSRYHKKPPTVREVVADLGPAGSPKNSRVCNARITMAANPVMRRSPYAGMMFNGQGRPINPDGYSATLHASMGGNKTPIMDEEHLYHNAPSWIEAYHAHLMSGGKPLPFDAAPPRLRRLTLDESIRLQTFPPNYQFAGSRSQIFTQVGNAVPCKLAQAVGCVVRDVLTSDSNLAPLSQSKKRNDQLALALA